MTAPPTAGWPRRRPASGPAELPASSAAKIGAWLAAVAEAEGVLRDALLFVGQRHVRDPQIPHGARAVSHWCDEHVESLEKLKSRFPGSHPDRATQLHDALFRGAREGGQGLVMDLQDLLLLVSHVKSGWTIVYQVADEIHDSDLLTLSDEAGRRTERTLTWVEAQIKATAPQAIAVPAESA